MKFLYINLNNHFSHHVIITVSKLRPLDSYPDGSAALLINLNRNLNFKSGASDIIRTSKFTWTKRHSSPRNSIIYVAVFLWQLVNKHYLRNEFSICRQPKEVLVNKQNYFSWTLSDTSIIKALMTSRLSFIYLGCSKCTSQRPNYVKPFAKGHRAKH